MADNTEDGSIIDYSNYSYPGEPVMYRTLDIVDYVMITIIGIVMIGTFLGNVSVITSVAFNKSMQKAANIYVANLAVADLLICAICMTTLLGKTFVMNHIYLLGPAMCKISSFGKVTCLLSSVFSLSAIACVPLPAVLNPLRYSALKKRRAVFINGIWLFSVLISLPLLFFRKFYEVKFYDFTMPTCADNWPEVYDEERGIRKAIWLRTAYYTFVNVLLCFLPVTIISVAYYLLVRNASKPLPGHQTEANVRRQIRNKKNVLRMAITVISVFVICWMPLQLITLYALYNQNDDSVLPVWYEDAKRFTEFLAFSNSFWNPIIYGFYNEKFRDSLCLLLRCKKSGKSEFFEKIRLTLTTSLSVSRNQLKVKKRNIEEKAVTSEAVIDSHQNGGIIELSLVDIELGTAKHKDGESPARRDHIKKNDGRY